MNMTRLWASQCGCQKMIAG